jgi:hypothetical protein
MSAGVYLAFMTEAGVPDDDTVIDVSERLSEFATVICAAIETADRGQADGDLKAIVILHRGGVMCSANLGYGNTREPGPASALTGDLVDTLRNVSAPFAHVEVFAVGSQGEEDQP